PLRLSDLSGGHQRGHSELRRDAMWRSAGIVYAQRDGRRHPGRRAALRHPLFQIRVEPMDRVSAANYATVGGKRQFQDLNLGANTAGTSFEQVWFNGVQEEIVGTIEYAGETPTDADWTQLRQAIIKIAG